MEKGITTEPIIQRNFGLRLSQFNQLEELSAQYNMKHAELIREAVDDLLKKYKVKTAA